MKVKIKEKEYALRYNLRAIIIFEKIADKPFEIKGTSDWSLLVYACLISANPDTGLSYVDFIDDASPSDLNKAIEQLAKAINLEKQLSDDTEEEVKKK